MAGKFSWANSAAIMLALGVLVTLESCLAIDQAAGSQIDRPVAHRASFVPRLGKRAELEEVQSLLRKQRLAGLLPPRAVALNPNWFMYSLARTLTEDRPPNELEWASRESLPPSELDLVRLIAQQSIRESPSDLERVVEFASDLGSGPSSGTKRVPFVPRIGR